MSATRDSSQPVTFIYTNLHDIYRKGLDAAREAVVPEAPVQEREHPRFGVPVSTDGQSSFLNLRSETYRVIKPALRAKEEGHATRASLRSSRRVIKVGELRQPEEASTHRPIHFLRRSTDQAQRPHLSLHKKKDPEIRLDLQLALGTRTSSAPVSTQLGRSIQSLDRLQSRLHFLLREIQEFSGSSGSSNSGEGT